MGEESEFKSLLKRNPKLKDLKQIDIYLKINNTDPLIISGESIADYYLSSDKNAIQILTVSGKLRTYVNVSVAIEYENQERLSNDC